MIPVTEEEQQTTSLVCLFCLLTTPMTPWRSTITLELHADPNARDAWLESTGRAWARHVDTAHPKKESPDE